MKKLLIKPSVIAMAIAASIGVAHGESDNNKKIEPKKITVGNVVIVENDIHEVGLPGAKLTGTYTIASGIEAQSTRKWYMIPREVDVSGSYCVTTENDPLTACTLLHSDVGDYNENSHLPLDSGVILEDDTYQGQKVVFCVIPTGSDISGGTIVSGEPECKISEETLQPHSNQLTPPTVTVDAITSADDPVNTNSTLTVTYTYHAPTSGSNQGEKEGRTILYWQNEEGNNGTIEIDELSEHGDAGISGNVGDDVTTRTATINLSEYTGSELLNIEGKALKACIQPVTVSSVHGEQTCSAKTSQVVVPDDDEAPVVTNVHIRDNNAAVSELKVGKQYHPNYTYFDADGDVEDLVNNDANGRTLLQWHVDGISTPLESYYFTPIVNMIGKEAWVCVLPKPQTGNQAAVEVCSDHLMIVEN